MTLVWEPQDKIVKVAEMFIPGGGFSPCKAALVPERAVLVFNNYRHRSIELSAYAFSPFWCTRQVMREIAHYVFIDNDCMRLEARTEYDNARAVKMMHGIGFTLEGILRKASWSGKDMLLFSILRDEVTFDYV